MSFSQQQTQPFDDSEKTDHQELEVKGDLAKGDVPTFTAVSQFANLGKWATARTFWLACLYAVGAGMAALFDGFAIVVPGSIVANRGFINQFSTLNNAAGVAILNPQIVGGWGGVQSGGQILGMWLGPFLSDRYGRKANLALLTVLLLIAMILEITARDWRVYLIARMMAGAGTGVSQSSVTVYISEVSPPQIRGALLSMYSVVYSLGGLIGSITLKVVNDSGPANFRNAFYAQFAFLGVWLPCLFLIPESPWFYARRHNDDMGKRMMARLYGNVPGWNNEHEYEVVRENVAHFESIRSEQRSIRFTEIFRGVNGRRTFISFFPLAFQQLSGLSLVLQYNAYFFGLAGLADPFLPGLIIKIVLLGFTIISFYTVEAAGRRPSLLIGGAVMGVCMLILGILETTHNRIAGLMVALFAIHASTFAISAGTIGWTMVAEVSTPRLRAKTAGFAAGGTACFGLIFNYTVPIMLANPGANWGLNIGYFWFGLICISLGVMWFAVPETKGRSYSELDELFEKKVPAWRFRTTKTSVDELKDSVQT